jgi:Tol biopolymer transport system component
LKAGRSVPLLLVPIAIVLAWPHPADAAYPGANGKIAFDRGSDIYTINPDGTGETNVTNNPASDFEPVWRPDGQKIGFETSRGPHGNTPFVMNPDGSGQAQLLPQDTLGLFLNSWRPDGQSIAGWFFTSNCDTGWYKVFRADVAGGEIAYLNLGSSARTLNAAWSPDGRKIAFERQPQEFGDEFCYETGVDIYLMNNDFSGQTPLVADGAIPDWSPDSQKILFTRAGNLWTVDADGSDQTQLTNGTDRVNSGVWSPDGTKIAFVREVTTVSGNRPPDLFVMNADGTQETRLTNNELYDNNPDWQPIVGSSPPPPYPAPRFAPSLRSRSCRSSSSAGPRAIQRARLTHRRWRRLRAARSRARPRPTSGRRRAGSPNSPSSTAIRTPPTATRRTSPSAPP